MLRTAELALLGLAIEFVEEVDNQSADSLHNQVHVVIVDIISWGEDQIITIAIHGRP